MIISAHGIAFIKAVEGCKLTAYQDGGGVWTIGVGHTGLDVTPVLVINDAKATALLLADLAEAETAVNAAVKVPIPQALYDSLVSLVFNAGPGEAGVEDGIIELKAGGPSTLLKLLNAGDTIGAIAEFAKWCHDGGKPVKGLLRRRVREMMISLEDL